MKDNSQNIKFCFSKPLEFEYALITTSMKEELTEILKQENNITIDNKRLDIIENIENKLSRYLKSELKYFFHMYVNSCSGIGQLIYSGFFKKNSDVKTVEEMLSIIEKSDVSSMFSYMIDYLFFENMNKNIDAFGNWGKNKKSISKMIEIVKNIEFKDVNMKQKVLECLENPIETKHRYCFLLRQFYEKAYKQIEDDIYTSILPVMDECIKLFNTNPSKFSLDFFKKDINIFEKEVNVHISYFRYLGHDYMAWDNCKEWICFGSSTLNFYNGKPKKQKILNFLKAISDKRRIEIIQILSKKSCYVNEIAEKMGMSAATASYHLTTLQDLNIVNFERYNHRFYYYLNKDIIKQLFQEALKAFINE